VSATDGVCQFLDAPNSVGLPSPRVIVSDARSPSPRVGVGQHAAATASSRLPLFRFAEPSVIPFVITWLERAVGQHEHSLASVWRTNIGRSNTSPFRNEPERGQIPEYNVESSNNESADVLHEDVLWFHLANDPSELPPESRPLAVDDASALAGGRDVLTREASNDAIHDSTPASAVEGGNVVPDRCRLQGLRFHPGHEAGRGVGFPLDVANSSGVGHGESHAEVEPAVAGEQGQHVEGTNSHTHLPSKAAV
jgi:hypothetical protein